jgi:glycine cleavage system H lipoate-binding protein
VNQSPEDKGWFVKLSLSAPKEADALFDTAAYKKHCEAAAEKH